MAEETKGQTPDEAETSATATPGEAETASAAPEVGESEGQHVGPYRILQKLGEGGMGVVYLAQQEEPVRRRVALKIIKHGMDTKQVVTRFEAERQALAMMDHHCIAKIFDAGQTPNGRPYFAMEYVQGIPITNHCDTHKLTVKERLRLFQETCEGVQHAHQKSVIHRDLKPSNILVTIQGDKAVPKIIDFGVAKATAQRLTERTLYTEMGVLVGTPEYMSPEQAEATAQDVDTRTDVYSLGVVLYELLAGALPFDAKELRGVGLIEMHRLIREKDPPKPSSRVSTLGEASTNSARARSTEPTRLIRQLRGDLDWINMKAMEKDRTRRYASASALSDDIERYLCEEPIVARPPSAAYQLHKFTRRNRALVAGGLAAFVALALGLAGTTYGLLQVTHERDNTQAEFERAQAEFERAQAINLFMQEVVRSAGTKRIGPDATVLEGLDSALGRLDEILAGEPEILAEVLVNVAQTYDSLDRLPDAERLLRRAMDMQTEVLGERHVDTLSTMLLIAIIREKIGDDEESYSLFRQVREFAPPSTSLFWTGSWQVARRLIQSGELKEAQVILEQLAEGGANSFLVGQLAEVQEAQQNYNEAERLRQQAVDLRRVETEAGRFGPEDMANALSLLGRIQARDDGGSCEVALPALLEALEIRQRALGSAETLRTVDDRTQYARCLSRVGSYVEAETLLLRNLDVIEASDLAPVKGALELAISSLVDLYEEWGKPEKAAEYEALLEERQQ